MVVQVLTVQSRGRGLSDGLAELTWPLPQFCGAAGVAAAEVRAWAVLARDHHWGAREDCQGRLDWLELGSAGVPLTDVCPPDTPLVDHISKQYL